MPSRSTASTAEIGRLLGTVMKATKLGRLNDSCRLTPYETVRNYSKNNLVTVRGGIPEGDPCGGRHLHSYAGREAVVVDAILAWINKSEVRIVVGE